MRGSLSPLGGEDPVEHGVLPAVAHGLQDEHVLDDVEGEAVVGQRAQQLGLQEGGPLLLQDPLSSFVALRSERGSDQRHAVFFNLFVYLFDRDNAH